MIVGIQERIQQNTYLINELFLFKTSKQVFGCWGSLISPPQNYILNLLFVSKYVEHYNCSRWLNKLLESFHHEMYYTNVFLGNYWGNSKILS